MRKALLLIFCIFAASFQLQAQCLDTLNLGNDTSICNQQTFLIDAGSGYMDYLWNTGSTSQTITISSSGTYICTVHALDTTNLVVNGDFSLGYTSFTSDYSVGTGGTYGQLSLEGTYAITTNTSFVHTMFPSYTDHTSGTGNMMVINGASVSNQNVWQQTINVTPNTDYDFSAWFMSVTPDNPAVLSFKINGTPIGAPITLSNNTGVWQSFASSWNSGGNNTATISISNQNTVINGNDFAIDDIYFAKVCQFIDSIEVDFGSVQNFTLGLDTIICEDDSILLRPKPSIANADYLWSNGSTDTSLWVNSTGTYWLDVSVGFCNNSDTIDISIAPKPNVGFDADPMIATTDDPSIDFINTTIGASNYLWLFGDNSNSTLQDPTHTYGNEGTYSVWLIANTNHGCSDSLMRQVQVVVNEIEIPNVITPNNDGVNDYFIIKNIESMTSSTLRIYNRWGNEIYEASPYTNDWNGNGAPDGVYFYELKYSSYFRTDKAGGTITIISR